ncbi:substrate-binding domain-containing protein [Paenibacillus hemerocallicola]|nr:GntR family transcriptional regulator [Paenibacillus hemerocallicola]
MYKQIQQYVLDEMKKQNWKADHKLPSESELSALFRVSRLTVKNALDDFIEQGFIYRIQGKGSYISPHYAGESFVFRDVSGQERHERPKLVACLLPTAFSTRMLNLLNGIEEELARLGFRLLFCKTNGSRDMEKKVIEEVLKLQVAGVIIYPVEGDAYSEEVLRLTLDHFPLVVIDRYLRGLDLNCVVSDNFLGARSAVEHLIQLGHSCIGFLSPPHRGVSSIEDRLAGYESALADHGVPVEHRLRDSHLVMGDVNCIMHTGRCDDEVKKGLQTFLKKNSDMTAIFAVNTGIGLNVIQVAEEMGLRIPEQLSVVFFDDYELSGFSRIPPTCVVQHEYELGKIAAGLIVSVIEDPMQERRKMEVPTELIVRQSTAPRSRQISK